MNTEDMCSNKKSITFEKDNDYLNDDSSGSNLINNSLTSDNRDKNDYDFDLLDFRFSSESNDDEINLKKNNNSFIHLASIDGLEEDNCLHFLKKAKLKTQEKNVSYCKNGSITSSDSQDSQVIMVSKSKENFSKESQEFKKWLMYDQSSTHSLKLECEDCPNYNSTLYDTDSNYKQTLVSHSSKKQFDKNLLKMAIECENKDLEMFCESFDQSKNDSLPLIECSSEQISQELSKTQKKSFYFSNDNILTRPGFTKEDEQPCASFSNPEDPVILDNQFSSTFTESNFNSISSTRDTNSTQTFATPLTPTLVIPDLAHSNDANIIQSLVQPNLLNTFCNSNYWSQNSISKADLESSPTLNNLAYSNSPLMINFPVYQDLNTKSTTILDIPTIFSTHYQKSAKSLLNESLDESRFLPNFIKSVAQTSSITPQQQKPISYSLLKPSNSKLSLICSKNSQYKSTNLNKVQYTTSKVQNGQSNCVRKFSNFPILSIQDNVLYNSLAKLKGFSDKNVDPKTLIEMKSLPIKWPSHIDHLTDSIKKLDTLLTNENFKKSPIEWSVKRGLIKRPFCQNCHKYYCTIQKSNSLLNSQKYWICNKPCKSVHPVQYPFIFENLKISISKLLFIIYCWAIQFDLNDLLKSEINKISFEMMHHVYSRIQSFCGRVNSSDSSKFVSFTSYPVDLATIQIEHLFVMGAMESKSKSIRLKVFDISEIKKGQENGINVFVQKAKDWIAPSSIIRVCENKFLSLSKNYKLTLIPKKTFCDFYNNTKDNPGNIGTYLIHHLQNLIKNINVKRLSKEAFSLVLSELEWREIYGYEPFLAFQNIVSQIAGDLRSLPYSSFSTFQSPLCRPFQKNAKLSNKLSNSNKEKIIIDEYFYSTWVKKKPCSSITRNYRMNINCHLCQMFFDNILISKHLLEHIEDERKNLKSLNRDSFNECSHCLKTFDQNYLKIHKDLFTLKLIKLSCRICCKFFLKKNDYLKHMFETHWPQEAPFCCDVCDFRSSFHKDTLDHFEKEHLGSEMIICPFCLMLFNRNEHKLISNVIYHHFIIHYAISSVNSCQNCSLVFTSKDDFKNHVFKAHSNPLNYQSTFNINSYKLPKNLEDFGLKIYKSDLKFYKKKDIILFKENDAKQKKDFEEEQQEKTKNKDNHLKKETFESLHNLDLPPDLIEKGYTCLECQNIIKHGHFFKYLIRCDKCPFSTRCHQVMENHSHSALNNDSTSLFDRKKARYICICGHSSIKGNPIAKHLALTGHHHCSIIK